MSEAIAIYDRIQDPVAAAERMGVMIAKSGLFGCDRAETGQVLALACLCERQSPFQILRSYHIIDGKLSKKALAIAAEFRARGGKIRWLKTGKDGKQAEAEFTFEGQSIIESFSIEEARAQGLIRPRSNWEKVPGNMLRARLLSNAISMLCPEIVAGVSGNPEDEADAPAAAAPAPLLKEADAAPVAPAQPQQQQAPSAQAQATPPGFRAALDPQTGKLDAETIMAIEASIPAEHQEAALAWLKAKGWINGQLETMSLARAQRIIDNPAGFIAHVTGGAK
ncbi:MAG TPA: hypothetical protein VEH27_02435 [Methylomirabilota bacterium]|nr:hypothetical protein [Methylomirabilota bacterium]